MPDIAIDELRLPELNLPEIKREEIVRTLSGIHPPEVDLSGARKLVADIDPAAVPAAVQSRIRALPGIDFGKLLAAALAASRFVRPSAPRVSVPRIRPSREQLIEIVPVARRRSRRRFAILAIALAAVASWGLLRDPGNKARLDDAARRAREWVRDQRAARSLAPDDIAPDEIAPQEIVPAAIAAEKIAAEKIAAEINAAEKIASDGIASTTIA